MTRGPLIFSGLVALAVIAATVRIVQQKGDAPTSPVAVQVGPATQPTTAPVVATKPAIATNYLELVRATHRTIKQTELLTVPIDLGEAAHLRLPNHAYICGRGDLWIAHPDAIADTATTLAKAADEQTHLLREPVDFVWWRRTDEGTFLPWVATKTTDGYEWQHAAGRVPMPTRLSFDWPRAIFWQDDAVIVPSPRGIAIVRVDQDESSKEYRFAIDHIDLIDADAAPTRPTTAPPPQFVTDGQGVVAWVPADAAGPNGTRVARYLDGKWSDLDPQAWPTSLVHLVPLIDGSVLRLTADGPKMKISLSPLAAGTVDEGQVAALVDQLSDPDPRQRQAAFQRLTQFGPAAWPLLERLRDEQPAEARLRIGQVLRDRTSPTLAGMSIVNDEARVVSRDRAGGVILHADRGVNVPGAGGKTSVVSPAWIALRPGRVPELLPEKMVGELRPDRHAIEAYKNEWIVRDDVNNARRYVGRQWLPLLRDDERDFNHLIGIDARGRWVFGRSTPGPTTTTADGAAATTLIIDPTLPDPTPRLPGWAIAGTKAAGWTAEDWPAVNVDGKDYRLTEHGWARLDPTKEKLIATLPPTPTTNPAPLAIAKGKAYLDGTTTIVLREPDKPDLTCPLPPQAHGSAPAHLVATSDDRLLIMNTPGRITLLSLDDTPAAAAPTIDATFTRKVPNGPIRRYWLDPAGRLCIAHDSGNLTVFFPQGIVPPAIRKMMPATELSD